MGLFTKEEVPKAPDMSPIIAAANNISQLGVTLAQQQLDWAKQQVATNQADVTKFVNSITSDADASRAMVQNFQDLSNQQLGLAQGATGIRDAAIAQAAKQGDVQSQQLAIQQQQLGVQGTQLTNQQQQLALQQDLRGDQQAQQQKADQLYQQYSQTYAPAQARFMADAEAYGTPEKLAQARAGAQANVADQFQAARDAATRQLESFGIKPSDTRFAALDLGTRIKEAAQKAASGDQAALTAEDKAFALRQAAIAQGKDLPSQATAATGAANQAGANVIGAGNTAVGAGNTAVAAGNTAVGAGNTAVGAGNAATAALGIGTGANNSAVGATSGATQAQQAGLAANTAAAGESVLRVICLIQLLQPIRRQWVHPVAS